MIAYGGGGALETVTATLPGQIGPSNPTGILFKAQTEASLLEALAEFETTAHRFNPDTIRQNAERFSEAVFATQYLRYLSRCQAKFQPKLQTENHPAGQIDRMDCVHRTIESKQ